MLNPYGVKSCSTMWKCRTRRTHLKLERLTQIRRKFYVLRHFHSKKNLFALKVSLNVTMFCFTTSINVRKESCNKVEINAIYCLTKLDKFNHVFRVLRMFLSYRLLFRIYILISSTILIFFSDWRIHNDLFRHKKNSLWKIHPRKFLTR